MILPRLAIAMVTCERTDLAVRTVFGIKNFLKYEGKQVAWFVGDDGSSAEHERTVKTAIDEAEFHLDDYHNEKMSPGTYFAGKTWNRVLTQAHYYSDFILWLEDDWELTKPIDITPYVMMLMEREDVGMVRLGHLAVGSDVNIVGHNGVHYLNYLRSTQYAYSGNPSLRHVRFTKALGPYAEDKNPGDIELDCDSRFRLHPEIPDIWRPADIPGWGVFGHTGTEKSWK